MKGRESKTVWEFGFHARDSGFRVLDSGFHKWIGFRITTDSTNKKIAGFRNTDSFTRGNKFSDAWAVVAPGPYLQCRVIVVFPDFCCYLHDQLDQLILIPSPGFQHRAIQCNDTDAPFGTHSPKSIYLSVCLSICLSVYRSIDPSIHRSIHPSIHRSVRSVRLSVRPSVPPSLPPIHPSIHPSIYLSIYLSILKTKLRLGARDVRMQHGLST